MASSGPVTQGDGTATTTPAQVLADRPLRRYLFVQNKGTDAIRLVFGHSPVGSEGILLKPDWAFEPLHVPSGDLWIVADSGSQPYVLVEG